MHTAPQQNINIYYLSEQAVTVEFGQAISEDLQQHISHFNSYIHQHPFPGFQTTVPAYTTLTVFFNPLQVLASTLPGTNCFEKVSHYIANIQTGNIKTQTTTAEVITIPVCYGGTWGPDVAEVAKFNNLTQREVIDLYSIETYTVYMIGFVLGFAYLGGMNPALTTPRKPTPRQAVPAGSVGIAGEQTGIYPLQTPGGWQIIGQTPLVLFDANRAQPALLQAGDRVKFEPITPQEFLNYSR